jgi:hypothetical protein
VLITSCGSFGLNRYSSHGSVLQGIGKQLLTDRRLKERYGALKKALLRGQTGTSALFPFLGDPDRRLSSDIEKGNTLGF